ncbi:MAG: DUF998 domain-containing protein [Euryarchaeota archaeon]|nr:DUF998 domain-containing protein [Euryarchaeota archaeon]
MGLFDKDPCWARRTAGALIMVAAFIVLMGIITSEALYPGYHTGEHDISDLAWEEPSATIFNTTMIVGGIMYSLTAILLRKAGLPRSVTVPAFLMGLGGAGVGIFPLYTGTPHVIAALMTFGGGSITALMAGRTADPPFKHISLALGTIGLISLVLFAIMWKGEPFGPLGEGGMERWVAYANMVWAIGFGGYLMNSGLDSSKSRMSCYRP